MNQRSVMQKGIDYRGTRK